MKMSKQNKWYVGIFIAVLLVAILASTVFNQNNALNFCQYDTTDKYEICFTTQSESKAAIITATSAVTAKSTVAPGEKVNINVFAETNRAFVPPMYFAHVLLKDSAGQVITIWDVTDQIVKQTDIAACIADRTKCSNYFVMPVAKNVVYQFSAPTTPGVYKVSYVVKDSYNIGQSSQIVATEENVLNVVGQTTTCPTNTCGNFNAYSTISGGVIQIQSCLNYDSSCAETRKDNFRTVCNSGYVISGQSGTFASGRTTCEKEVTVPVIENPVVKDPVVTPQYITVYDYANNVCTPTRILDNVQLSATQFKTIDQCSVFVKVIPPKVEENTINLSNNDPYLPDNGSVVTPNQSFFEFVWKSIVNFFTEVFGA